MKTFLARRLIYYGATNTKPRMCVILAFGEPKIIRLQLTLRAKAYAL